MTEYKKITKSEDVRALKLTTNDKGYGYGSARFKGQTLDIILNDEYIKRVTFGYHVSFNHVAVISEIIKIRKEPDFIDHVLNQSAYENGWD